LINFIAKSIEMIERDIFKSLEKHLEKKWITVITGMRRVGKTTALKYLLFKVATENKVYFDLERVEHRYLFRLDNYKEIERSLQAEGIDLKKKAVIALDEIQLVPSITSVIKYLYDNFDIKFLVTGSSSFYLKHHFSESLAGRKRIYEMYPLSFGEYLRFKEIRLVEADETEFPRFNLSMYNRMKPHYEDFITFGGFPEVVLTEDREDKEEYLKDIINAYIELDIKLLSDFSATDDLYKLIRLLGNRIGSKTDFTKLSDILGINRQKIKDYLQLLEHTYFMQLIPPFSKNPDREISLQKKIYFSDTGILNVIGVQSQGALFENAVALQLMRKGEVNYYARKTGQEIDFILDKKEAVEVKETPSASDLNTLTKRAQSLNLSEMHLVGRYFPPSGFKDFTWAGDLI
jgi:uncharacterized protein